MGFPRQEYWSGLHSLFQGIFPTQGLNLCLLRYRWILTAEPLCKSWLWFLLSLKTKTCLICGHFTLSREESSPDKDCCYPGDIPGVVERENGDEVLWVPRPSASSFLTDPLPLELKVLWPAVQTPWGSEEFPPCKEDPGKTAEVWGKPGPEDPTACPPKGAPGAESLGTVLPGHCSSHRGDEHFLSPHNTPDTLILASQHPGTVEVFQFSSVAQLCPTLHDPMNHSTPDLPTITNSRSLLKLTSIKSVMPSSHLILCRPLSSCPQSLPALGSFPMSQLFAWGGQSIGVSALALVLPKNTQD